MAAGGTRPATRLSMRRPMPHWRCSRSGSISTCRPDLLPDDYLLLTIDLGDLTTEHVATIPTGPAAFCDTWLREQRTALLLVPSLIVPESANVLLNPVHPHAARASIVARRRFAFDRRLWLPL